MSPQKNEEQNMTKQKNRINAATEKAETAEQKSIQKAIAKQTTIELPETENTTKCKKLNSKTNAKAMGLKSTLVFDNKIVLTSFTSENHAVYSEDKKTSYIEKMTDQNGQDIKKIAPRMFDSNITNKSIKLTSKKAQEKSLAPTTQFCNPYSNCGKDYIGVKEQLEKKVFNKSFPNDNLRIQIAYNILDIKKILAPYINSIVYIVRNLGREKDLEYIDIVGSSLQKDFNSPQKNEELYKKVEQLLNNTTAYYTYFNNVFLPDQDSKNDKREMIFAHNFNVLRILSFARQIYAHNKIKTLNKELIDSDYALFNFENFLDINDKTLSMLLNKLYSSNIDNINKTFSSNAGKIIKFIQTIYPNESLYNLTKEYYDFLIKKDNCNVGINLRQIRESIIDLAFSDIRNDSYNNYNGIKNFRRKLYMVWNFILFKETNTEKMNAIIKDMIDELRKNKNGDAGKNAIYIAYAKAILKIVSVKFNNALENLMSNTDTDAAIQIQFPKEETEKIFISADNTDGFTKLIYFICQFLDGKEINELCCALINKFDNIYDLLISAKQCGESVNFVKAYEIFNRSNKLSEQIRIVKAVSKMKPTIVEPNKTLIFDALNLLGYKIIKYKTDENGKQIKTNEYKKFENLILNNIENGSDDNKRTNNTLINFINNNILKSKWFFYVAKYNNPESCYKLMRNKNLIEIALKNLPPEQIKRYYKSTIDDSNKANDYNEKAMFASIVDALYNFSIETIINDISKFDLSAKDKKQKNKLQKKQALVKLYLTIVYLITKNMVKINTRFSIAWMAMERDLKTKYECKREDSGPWLTQKFLENDKKIYDEYDRCECEIKKIDEIETRKKHRKQNDLKLKNTHFKRKEYDIVCSNVKDICKFNIIKNNGDIDNIILRCFRNNVMHLSIIQKMCESIDKVKNVSSFYAFYCYVLQCIVLEEADKKATSINKEQVNKYIAYVNKFGQYDKNLMWKLNTPFAYNLARYKNLSNETLFYRVDSNE